MSIQLLLLDFIHVQQPIPGTSIENAVFDVLSNDAGPLLITTAEETTAFVTVPAGVDVTVVLVVVHPYPLGSRSSRNNSRPE